jgi:hypothetical protein
MTTKRSGSFIVFAVLKYFIYTRCFEYPGGVIVQIGAIFEA